MLPACRGGRESTVPGVSSGFLAGSGGGVNPAPVASSCPRRRLPGALGAAGAWVWSLPHGGCALFTSPLSLSPELCVKDRKSRFRAPTLQACGSWVGRPTRQGPFPPPHPHLLSWRPPVWALTGVLPRRRASPGCCQVPCTPSQGAPTSRRSWGGSAPRRGFALRNVLSSPRAGTPPRPAALLVTPLSFGVLPLYLLGFVMAPLRHPSRGPSCTLRVSARRPSWALLTALLSDRRLPLCSRATLPLSLICPPGW